MREDTGSTPGIDFIIFMRISSTFSKILNRPNQINTKYRPLLFIKQSSVPLPPPNGPRPMALGQAHPVLQFPKVPLNHRR
jgi:hypothetical protein